MEVTNPRPVRRCVCTELSFAEVKAKGYRSLEEIGENLGCGQHCGSCRPYLRKMLESGETEFEILPPEGS